MPTLYQAPLQAQRCSSEQCDRISLSSRKLQNIHWGLEEMKVINMMHFLVSRCTQIWSESGNVI